MKKFLALALCMILAIGAYAQVRKVYVNPIENSSNLDNVTLKRLYKKGLLGFTKAKSIEMASGDHAITPGSAEAAPFDFILTLNVKDAVIEESVVDEVKSLLGSKSKEPTYVGKIIIDLTVVEADTGDGVFQTEFSTYATDKDKSIVIFNSTEHFDYMTTDMTDDAFQVGGEIVEALEVDKKGVVKKVRLQIGSKTGGRLNQNFTVYKVANGERTPVGEAELKQILSPQESVLEIKGKKEEQQNLSQLLQNNDGSYTIEAWSHSRTGMLHESFQTFDKLFSKEGRSPYLEPFGRTAKARVAFRGVDINDNAFSAQYDNFVNKVLEGTKKARTITLVEEKYPSVEAAQQAGLDGLVEVTIDKLIRSTETTSEGKTKYVSKLYYTIAGLDVANNRWINMKSFDSVGSSTESESKADAETLATIDDKLEDFCEDLYPVAGQIVEAVEVDAKKNKVKKVRINIGDYMGLTKGMKFDIFEQRGDATEDSRFLIGEGTVEKDGLEANSAVLKVKGKNDGDKRIYDLLQNADENTVIVLVSKASYDVFDKLGGLKF